ncbi:heparinase II/III family protein [Alphaproteobacteria bacterium KMM 3653]|uniref:Heparinase II/III family protein n=2 Tax=Harenicola maris TaxID=2841044 RepID=A0AAP2CPY0_9RHOB|nr:heparinase II/III family protein [Harenicola maris]
MNRVHARFAGWGAAAAAFTSQPEPKTIGSFARGRQLIAGNLLFAGSLLERPGEVIWDVDMPTRRFETALQGFHWLDDLAAVGDRAARDTAQDWTWAWIERYGRGTGPGWTPDLTGRRLIRWINHAIFLLNGRVPADGQLYFRALAAQTRFLARRWKAAAPGLPRFEALVGLVYSGLALQGMDKHVAPAVAALAVECDAQIDAEGGIPTRNPEELLEVFTLLVWASEALRDADMHPPMALMGAIERIAPTLRALRHADGGLARFHGGERGLDGRLDHALGNSGTRVRTASSAAPDRTMGFARLSAGRTSVVMDAAVPPQGPASANAHASTLAIEVTSGRRPLIVNCGSGASFGEDWRRAGRATASHSALSLVGYSSARFGLRGNARGEIAEMLEDGPSDVRLEKSGGVDGAHLLAGHDGYVATHGLTHLRRLTLSPDGRSLTGQDTLSAFSEDDRAAFDAMMTRTRLKGAEFAVRFHLHPDVAPEVDLGGTAISLGLKSSEVWIMRCDGSARMTLEPSVYLEAGRLKPRACQQIVLRARVADYARQIGWTLAKAQDTPQGVRDYGRIDELPLD